MKRFALVFLAAAAATVACDTDAGPEPTPCAVWLECYSTCRVDLDLPLDPEATPGTPAETYPELNACSDMCEGVGTEPFFGRIDLLESGGELPLEFVSKCLTGDLEV